MDQKLDGVEVTSVDDGPVESLLGSPPHSQLYCPLHWARYELQSSNIKYDCGNFICYVVPGVCVGSQCHAIVSSSQPEPTNSLTQCFVTIEEIEQINST